MGRAAFGMIVEDGANIFGIVRGDDGAALLIDADIRRIDEIEQALEQTRCSRVKYYLSNNRRLPIRFTNDSLYDHVIYFRMSLKLSVQVKPQSRNKRSPKFQSRNIESRCRCARGRKANEEVVKLLARYFSVSKSSVKVLRGQSSRKKLVEIG